MAFIYDLTDTWNAGGTTFSAIKMNVTDTASAAASKLITVQVGGAEKFGVRKDGQGYFAGNVGIGTTSPLGLLEVANETAADNQDTQVFFTTRGTGSGSDVILNLVCENTTTGEAFINFGDSAATDAGQLRYNHNGDSMEFRTNSAERMRITSAGNVGIGTSSPTTSQLHVYTNTDNAYAARFDQDHPTGWGVLIDTDATVNTDPALWVKNATDTIMWAGSGGNVGIGTSSPGEKLHISGAGTQRLRIAETGSGAFTQITQSTTNTGIIAAHSSGDNYINFNTTSGGATAEAMRITSAGNVGIGVTPAAVTHGPHLDVGSTRGTVSIGTGYIEDNGTTQFFNGTRPLAFGTAATERMRITSFGELALGCTSSQENATSGASGHFIRPTSYPIFAADSSIALLLNRTGSDGQIAQFRKAGSTVGFISVTSSATTYNTSSDYRLKDIDGPIANSGSYIDALKPVQGSWKADGSRFIGLLAHEVQEVSETQIATGEKDGEDMQAMDYSAPEIIANLIAEVQSLRARVAQLEG